MNSEKLKAHIEAAIPGAFVEVVSEDNVHFEGRVIATAFEGLNRVKQQQMVYSALGDLISSGAVHAFSFKTFTPEQWQAKQAN